jgi:hypothetical protein
LLRSKSHRRSPSELVKRIFLAGFCRETREIDFHAPKLRRRVAGKARFLRETAPIKPQKVAEYCARRAVNRF